MSLRKWKWQILYVHPSAWVALALVLVHQSIVAGSTVFLTKIIERFQAHEAFSAYLYLYLLSMTVPYIPGTMSFVFLQKWINSAHASFARKLIFSVSGNVERYRNPELRERTKSVLARSSYLMIRDYVSAVHDLASFSLNSALSMIVIGLLLPPQLLFGYGLSLVLCFLIVLGLRHLVSTASSIYENNYVSFSGVLDKCWENLALGNKHSQLLWQEKTANASRDFYSSSSRLQLLKQAGNILLATASLGPTIFLIVSIVRDGHSAPAILAAVIVSLTRVFLILNSLSALVYKALDFFSMQARLAVLFEAEMMMSDENTIRRGEIKTIIMNGEPVNDATVAVEMVSLAKNGRFKISGANGSGKSTVLLALKNRYKDDSFLLPANHADLTWKTNDESMSTGQKTASLIAEILQIDDIKYLLLDEWDANIDAKNTQCIDLILDEVSKTKVVVEIRH